MSNPYVGEIRIVGFNFAPQGWAFCNGSLLPINQYSVLFDLLGTIYGGDGTTTFALPNLQGRVPVHVGQGSGLNTNYVQGVPGGEANHTLTTAEIPAHTHALIGVTDAATTNDPTANFLAQANGSLGSIYGPATNLSVMNAQAVVTSGGSQPHNNLQQYLPLNFIISLFGIFPSQG